MDLYCNFAIAQHYEARDAAIEHLVRAYNEGVDIGDRATFNAILDEHNLRNDGFCSEESYIIKEVSKRICS